MKIFAVILYVAAVAFCIAGLFQHTAAFAAAAMCFFAATMIIVGKRNEGDKE